jgi:beta-glucanase (GH16 family)
VKKNILFISIAIACYGLIGCRETEHKTTVKPSLVWSDEFDYTGLPDSTKWGYDTGGHGWGNQELQYYTNGRPQNASVADGLLTITAIKEPFEGAQYTSARLVSKNKGDWTFGQMEIRAKMPRGRGTWPAIWMLPTHWEYGDWPRAGEIDIMEFVGYQPDSVFATVHTKSYNHSIGTQVTKGLYMPTASDSFHVYAIDWDSTKIDFLIDGVKFHQFKNDGTGVDAWPFDKAFHFLLNIAVGGGWGGKMGVDDTIFPQNMQVDYVRVYQ